MSINQRHSHSWRWWDGEKIDYNNLKNLPDLDTVKYFQDNDTTWTGVYSGGDFVITTWFRPKRIDIKAARDSSNEWVSTWTAIVNADGSIENGCIYLDGSFTNVWQLDWTVIWIIKQSSSSTVFFVKSVSDTWFTLNVNNNNWTFDTVITAQG
jgi:hypothetical protein